MKKLIALSTALLAFAAGCTTFRPARMDAPPAQPYAEREFRAAWVATVANIDWPSQPGLTTEEQKREVRAILDTAVSIGLNAIVLQVRPQADALYESSLEPWSYFLTGEQGKAPEPFYDPLTFWVDEAHDRGIELHAWFNPYRVHVRQGGPVSEASIANRKPHLVRVLPNGMYWMDPAHPETKDHSLAVVMDVVKRYDIDGVHFDDYFYPYGGENFPDDSVWKAYVADGGSMSRSDWRRSQVNTFIERLYASIKAEKPHVKFGISPFGIWRPSYPPSIAGFDQYEGLFADARLWLNEGWVDYFSPQLYWSINQVPQSFPVLLGWWTRENIMDRNLWPGVATYRMVREGGLDELVNQIMVARGFLPESPGHIHFSFKYFMQDSTEFNDGLRTTPYRRGALVPPSPWLDAVPPAQPFVNARTDSTTMYLVLSHPDKDDVFRWVVYEEMGGRWGYTIHNRYTLDLELPLYRYVDVPVRDDPDSVETRTDVLTQVAVSAVDRMGNESEKIFVQAPAIVPPPPPAARPK